MTKKEKIILEENELKAEDIENEWNHECPSCGREVFSSDAECSECRLQL